MVEVAKNVEQKKDDFQAEAVDLFASVGLMLDLEHNLQLYHSWRVAAVGYHLANRVSSFEAPLIFLAGLLADCGAVHFPRHIVHELNDYPAVIGQKSLTHLFFHPVVGKEALRHLPGMRHVADLVYSHHEHINGSGYPRGLSGDQIPMGAQILRLADQFDLVVRSDQPENVSEVIQSLQPFGEEEFSSNLLNVLKDLLNGELSYERMLLPEKIGQEVHRICHSLKGLQLFSGYEDWDCAFEAIGRMIDRRNELYTRGHSREVALLAERIAQPLRLDDSTLRTLRWSAYLQNMGEVSLRSVLLEKKEPLNEQEKRWIRYHPVVGHDLISRVVGMKHIATVVRHHHENFDGSGYPEGLNGEKIPLASRILRVADTFTAMTSERPYHRKREWKTALKELRKQSGRLFDPQIVEAALSVLS